MRIWATYSANPHTRSSHGLAPLDFQHMVSSPPDGAADEGKASPLLRALVPSFLRSSSLAVFSFASCYRNTCSCITKPIRCGNMILVLPSTRKRRVTSQIETQKCQIFSTSSRFDTYMGSWGANDRDSAEKLKSAGRLAFRQSYKFCSSRKDFKPAIWPRGIGAFIFVLSRSGRVQHVQHTQDV